MARFDFGAEARRRSVKSGYGMDVDGVKFKLVGKIHSVTDEELTLLASLQDGKVTLTYPKVRTAAGKVVSPTEQLLPKDVGELMELHTKAASETEPKLAVA